MNQDQSRTLTQIIETLAGYKVHEKRGGKFYFNFYLNQKMSDTPIEALDLNVRAYNSLKRAGYSSIGQLAVLKLVRSGTAVQKVAGRLWRSSFYTSSMLSRRRKEEDM